MLTKKQVNEIREHLEKAQNPIFLFDNDQDGLCSFLLLQRYLGRGKGFPIKSFPGMTGDYFRKVEELNADYIFIVDKPVVSKEFFEKVRQKNIPVVWIDHHEIDSVVPKFVNYYNPLYNKVKTNEPVTALCYQVAGRKEDIWLAVVGCIADKFVPKFYPAFEKKYPDLAINSKDAFEILYNSQIGKLTRILGFSLNDKTTNVINMLKFMMKVKTPYDVFEEGPKNYSMHERFKEVDKKYRKFLNKALEESEDEKLLFFQYAGEMSFSGYLSNELSFKFPEKIIVVAYIKGIKVNISARGKKVREVILKALKGLKDSRGGGHEEAVGAQVNFEDLDKFKENIVNLLKR